MLLVWQYNSFLLNQDTVQRNRVMSQTLAKEIESISTVVTIVFLKITIGLQKHTFPIQESIFSHFGPPGPLLKSLRALVFELIMF